jgi:hypothetical protein
MQNPQDARFMAATFTVLQGLKLIPMGLVIALLAIYADTQTEDRRNLTVPILALGLGALFYFAIQRYYQRTYGTVRQTRRHKIEYLLLSLVFAGFGYAAILVEDQTPLPVSLLGLLVAVGLVYDAIRLTWSVRGRYLWFAFPIAAAMLVISILPALGAHDWWQWIGFHSGVYAVTLLVGIITILMGLGGHLVLRSLVKKQAQAV